MKRSKADYPGNRWAGHNSSTIEEVAVLQQYHQARAWARAQDALGALDKYGAVPQVEAAAEARAAGEAVVQKIYDHFHRVNDIDPEDVVALDKLKAEEAAIIMKCPSCSPPLRERWNVPERKALGERYGKSGLQKDVAELKKAPR